jgi:hypothetical protein
MSAPIGIQDMDLRRLRPLRHPHHPSHNHIFKKVLNLCLILSLASHISYGLRRGRD